MGISLLETRNKRVNEIVTFSNYKDIFGIEATEVCNEIDATDVRSRRCDKNITELICLPSSPLLIVLWQRMMRSGLQSGSKGYLKMRYFNSNGNEADSRLLLGGKNA